MAQIDENLLDRFANVLGDKGISRDPSDIKPWLTDWRGTYHGASSALLSPSSTAEVAAVVKLAAEMGVPLVAQGGNTGMVGGATPSEDGCSLILSLRRMNQVRGFNLEAQTAVAEAGVILSNFHDAAIAQGLRFPLTLGGKGSATIGGLVSTNAGGTQVLRFGTMRKLVLGLEAVLPDGSIFNGLAALKKDNRGYDLSQLLVGAEGTLGIVTAACLKLYPAVTDRAAAWIGVASPHVALKMLRFMEARSGNAIESFEVVPAETLALVLKHIPGTRAPLEDAHPWNVLIEYVGSPGGADATAALTELVTEVYDAGFIGDAAISANEAQIEAFWHLRDSISEAEAASGPAMHHDISVPVDAMPDFMIDEALAVQQKFPGVTAAAFGHLGDGNVHFHVRAPKGVDGAAWREAPGKAISSFVYDRVIAAQGSISAEHGIGQNKRAELLRLSDPARIGALRAIKAALDPKGIMNPGKLVPLASDAPDA